MLQGGIAGLGQPVLPPSTALGRAALWRESPGHWHWQLLNLHGQKILSLVHTLDSGVPTWLEDICKLKHLSAGAKDFGTEECLAGSKTL